MRREPKYKGFIESVRPDYNELATVVNGKLVAKYQLSSTYGKKHKTMAKEEKRQHKATYATDKRNGGYLIRVQGPFANRFVGRHVPVTKKNNEESEERLLRIVWTGNDQETGVPVALYTFEAKPRDEEDNIPF